MTESQYQSYFEALATKSREINHNQDGNKAFIYVEDPDNLDAFDNALRNLNSSLVMLLTASSGELNDNNSENHTHQLEGQFYIIARTGNNKTILQARDECFPIVISMLGRMRIDGRKNQIVPGKTVNFRIDEIPYEKVGPMDGDWYGYTVLFRFICPFGYTADSSIWRDIT